MKIGIQGAIGSFSEEASKKFIENHGIKNPEIKYLISSKDVLSNVENRKVDYGIFAMENAQGGVVIESVEALALHKCKIIEMFHIQTSKLKNFSSFRIFNSDFKYFRNNFRG